MLSIPAVVEWMNTNGRKLESCKHADENSGTAHKNVENPPQPRDSAKTDDRAKREDNINGHAVLPPEIDDVVHRVDAHRPNEK